jgi:hypothetical protein
MTAALVTGDEPPPLVTGDEAHPVRTRVPVRAAAARSRQEILLTMGKSLRNVLGNN